MDSYLVGNTVVFKVEFRHAITGALIAPTTLLARVFQNRDPVESYTLLTDIRTMEPGRYELDVVLDTPGHVYCYWLAGGNFTAAFEDAILVKGSQVLARV